MSVLAITRVNVLARVMRALDRSIANSKSNVNAGHGDRDSASMQLQTAPLLTAHMHVGLQLIVLIE